MLTRRKPLTVYLPQIEQLSPDHPVTRAESTFDIFQLGCTLPFLDPQVAVQIRLSSSLKNTTTHVRKIGRTPAVWETAILHFSASPHGYCTDSLGSARLLPE